MYVILFTNVKNYMFNPSYNTKTPIYVVFVLFCIITIIAHIYIYIAIKLLINNHFANQKFAPNIHRNTGQKIWLHHENYIQNVQYIHIMAK